MSESSGWEKALFEVANCVNELMAICIVERYVSQRCRYLVDSGNAQGSLYEQRRSFLSSLKIQELLDEIIVKRSNELQIDGETIESKLSMWSEYFKDDLGAIDELVLTHWLFTSVFQDDVLIPHIPEKVDLCGFDTDRLLRKYTLNGILDLPIQKRAKELLLLRCSVLLCPYVFASCKPIVASNMFFNMLLTESCQSFPAFLFVSSEAVLKTITPWNEKCLAAQKKRFADTVWPHKLVIKEEGVAGECWFATDIVPARMAGRVESNECFAYPIIHIPYQPLTAETGRTSLRTLLFQKGFLEGLFCETGWFAREAEVRKTADINAIPARKTKATIKLDYDCTDEGILQDFHRNFDLYTKGFRSINPNGLSDKEVLTDMKPRIFLHYRQVHYQMYTLWDYCADIDDLFYERPICITVISPPENAEPDQVIVGIVHSEFDMKTLLSGLLLRSGLLWSVAAFQETEEAKTIQKKQTKYVRNSTIPTERGSQRQSNGKSEF